MIKIASEKDILSFFTKAYATRKQKYFGFYNSISNHIVTQEKYMLLPVDDRTATRAHGVFDVVYMKGFKLLNLDSHISRLHRSAEASSIVPPFSEEKTKAIVI